MPALLEAEKIGGIDWPAVRVLAIAVGVREAARRLGISEEATMKRCQREGWLTTPEARLAASNAVSLRQPSALSAAVRTPANALAEAMREDSVQCRASLLRTARRASARVERCDDDELMLPEVATVLNQHAKTAALAGGWNAQSTVGLKIQLGAVSSEPLVMTMEAEIVSEEASQNVADY